MPTIKAVINDVDGNIVKSEEACWLLENEIFGLMGIPPMTREIHQQTWGMHLEHAVVKRSDGAADPAEFWKLFDPTYKKRVAAGLIDLVTDADLEAVGSAVARIAAFCKAVVRALALEIRAGDIVEEQVVLQVE